MWFGNLSALPLLAVLVLLPALTGMDRHDDLPVLAVSGEVLPADGGSPHDLVVRVRAGAFADSAAVDAMGSFSIPLPRDLAGRTVEVRIDAASGTPRRYHPALLQLTPRELHRRQDIILVPRQWRIAAGQYAGQMVEISLHRAFAPPCYGCPSFYRSASTAGWSEPIGGLSVWPAAVFPLRVAFDRERSDQRITARDSAAFWRIAGKMDAAFGRPLFRAAAYDETLIRGEEGPTDVVLVWIVASMRHPGRGSVGFYRDQIISGTVSLRNTSLISAADGPSLVTHELMHALGFGHTCSWRSVLADVTRCPSMRSAVPTATDVAYIELAYGVSTLARSINAPWGIEAALAGERALVPAPLRRPEGVTR
jgi:hypothetical protein